MTTSVTISVHCEEDANIEYHERNGVTWLTLTSNDGSPVAVFGPPERLRRLFAEALAAIPEPAPATECLHGDYHRPGQCPEANAVVEHEAVSA